MDTRNKILVDPWPEFARPLAVVAGYFDVLRAGHVRELEQAREAVQAATLLVIVLAGGATVLPQRVRAELVAALRVVNYVAAREGADVERLAALLEPAHLVRLEEADRCRIRELRELVQARTADKVRMQD